MAEWVVVRNTGTDLALVGERYLLPGEQNTVLKAHYEAARERYPAVVLVEAKIEANATKAESNEAGVDEDQTEPGKSKKKPARQVKGVDGGKLTL